jgi:two-component system, cell cycle sensor histidine kinase and response regulator CckA
MNHMLFTSAPQVSDPADITDDLPDAETLRGRDQRLVKLKRLVAHLVHDMSNLLVPMAGYGSLLKEHIAPGTVGANYSDRMQDAFEKMDSYISLVLQATHPQRRFSPRTADLTNLLRRKLELWMKHFPASHQIAVETSLEPCRFLLDESQWNALFQHLLTNAREAMEKAGVLRVLLRRRSLSDEQAAGIGVSDTSVFELIFEDTGCGMSEETMEHACDPFFTTKTGGQAAGLGLTLAHSVVQLHGGQISLASTDGQGTRVSIWLPASAT